VVWNRSESQVAADPTTPAKSATITSLLRADSCIPRPITSTLDAENRTERPPDHPLLGAQPAPRNEAQLWRRTFTGITTEIVHRPFFQWVSGIR
jgi:hypothetical protein